MNTLELIKQKFGRVVILTMSSRNDRRNMMRKQLDAIGMRDSEYVDCGNAEIPYVSYHFATDFPYNALIANAFNKSGAGRFTKANEYDCARNHYSIIKESLDLGFESVLVMEDDILFLKNTRTIDSFLAEIPDDWDLLQFGGFTQDTRIVGEVLSEYPVKKWVEHPRTQVWNASMYALSVKGMKYYLAFMNKMFWVADGPLYKAPLNSALMKSYISTVPVVIQADKNECASDIRNAETDSIDYNTTNAYESLVNKNDYGIGL